jgi:hypothetical protein
MMLNVVNRVVGNVSFGGKRERWWHVAYRTLVSMMAADDVITASVTDDSGLFA